MTYDQAVKQACRKATETGREWLVIEHEEGCSVTDDESKFGSCIYLAEPCAESEIIAR